MMPVFILLVIIANTYFKHIGSVTEKKRASLFTLDEKQLSNGDLIFRKGRDLASSLVLAQGNSGQFSHVGVIVKQQGIVSVVHSVPEQSEAIAGVQTELLSHFISFDNASDIAVYQMKVVDDKAREKILEYLLQQIGKPFDDDFLLSTDKKIYCTELVIKAFAYAGVTLVTEQAFIEIIMLDEPVLPPDHLRRSSLLKKVI
jgi:uncharacterized protein YycO